MLQICHIRDGFFYPRIGPSSCRLQFLPWGASEGPMNRFESPGSCGESLWDGWDAVPPALRIVTLDHAIQRLPMDELEDLRDDEAPSVHDRRFSPKPSRSLNKSHLFRIALDPLQQTTKPNHPLNGHPCTESLSSKFKHFYLSHDVNHPASWLYCS
jgi:hypothetical protein